MPMLLIIQHYTPIKPKIGRGFWLQWVLVTLAGFLVSLYWVEVGERPDVRLLEGAIGGAAIGLAQWFVLKQQFYQAWSWVLVTTLSWGLVGVSSLGALGWVAPSATNIPMRAVYGAVNGAVVGTLMGVTQWLFLRKQSPRAGWWIFASTGGWTVGLTLGWLLGGLLRKSTGLFLSEVLGLTLGWFVVATTTGIALCYVAETTVPQKVSK